jgi:large subunit ribosomal protein L3
MRGIIGRKVGMTQIFEADGKVVPVTVLQMGPCLVVQRRSSDTDGYDAVQVGLVEPVPQRRQNRAMKGHFDKAGVPAMRYLQEFRVPTSSELKAGDSIGIDTFAEQEYVDVIGTSKGKGFQGVIKRHGFAGGRASHGSMFHRAPGSIGQSSYPSRVFPGLRMAGRMGGERVTSKNLQIVKIDAERNLVYVRGAVPGSSGSLVTLREARRGT